MVRRVSDNTRSMGRTLAPWVFVYVAALGIGVLATIRPWAVSSSSAATSDAAVAPESAAPLTLGAFPHHSLLQLEAFYAPLAMYLSESLQRPVRFGTSSSYERFESRLERRDFDIVFIGAEDYVQHAHPAGYIALVRRTTPTTVIFIVAPSSSLSRLEDLRGTTIAMPPEVTPEAHLGIERLHAAGLDCVRDATVNYLPHHNACIQHVATGRAVTCVTTTDALSFVAAEAGKDYRVLDQAGRIPPALFAVAPSVLLAERDQLAQALVGWPDQSDREGGPVGPGWFELERVDDAEYDALRRALERPTARGTHPVPDSGHPRDEGDPADDRSATVR